jgi:hypothetical protein
MTWIAFGLAVALRAAGAAEFDHSHAPLTKILQRFVTNDLVAYQALKADRQDLDRYVDQLATVPAADFRSWTKPRQLAFLINLYNATTLRLIIDHYPVKSIKKIGSLWKGPWSQPVVRLFGGTSTLDDLEHGMIRRDYAEPRVHFALVCAARSCPPLRAEAYRADVLEAQLEEQGRRFLGNTARNSVDATRGVVTLSPLFKWFAGDFEAKSGSVLQFVQPYFPAEARTTLAREGIKIRYSDYDWSLNDGKH